MHQHLGKIRAVRLVFRQREDQLRRPAHASIVLGDDDRPFASVDALRDAAPEGDRLVARERMHEADGGAAFDDIHQHVGQSTDLGLTDRQQPAHREVSHR